MTTAEYLGNVNESDFQSLASAILALDNDDYASIIESGANSRGQTIKAESDAWCLIPHSDPPHYIFVEHTITRPPNLEEKWLRESPETKLGDLIKQCRRAARVSRHHPNKEVQVTIVLTSSQRLPKLLGEKVHAKAAELSLPNQLKIGVDIWEQSRIARFLDTRPEGQWLRKRHLGIGAEMLSQQLLHELCGLSLQNYFRDIQIAGEHYVNEREADQRLSQDAERQAPFHVLVGPSGFGKSTSLYHFLHGLWQNGEFTLWVPASFISAYSSLDSTLEAVLHELCPTLLPNSISRLWELLSSSPLRLAVDDINRRSSATQDLHRIIGWVHPGENQNPSAGRLSASSNGDSFSQGATSSAITLFCPVWPQIWAAMDSKYQSASWIQTTFFESMSDAEAVAVLEPATLEAGVVISSSQAQSLATQMSCDPYLVGQFVELVSQESNVISEKSFADLESLAKNVISRNIETHCNETSRNSPTHLSPSTFRKALARVGAFMLQHRKLHPLQSEVETWMNNDGDTQLLTALRELTWVGSLCREHREESGSRVFWEFRHDRLQHVFLVEEMKAILQKCTESSTENQNPFTNEWLLVSDPYFAEVVADALTGGELNSQQIELVCNALKKEHPLALAFALRNVLNANTILSNNKQQNQFASALKEWTQCASKPDWPQVEAISQILENIHHPLVVTVAEPLSNQYYMSRALLRNGILSTSLLSYIGKYWHSFDARLMEAGDWGRSHHRMELVSQLNERLLAPLKTHTDGEYLIGALAMTGILHLTEVAPELTSCWQRFSKNQRNRFLPLFIFALLGCYPENEMNAVQHSENISELDTLLGELLDVWQSLSDEKEPAEAFTARSLVTHTLYQTAGYCWSEVGIKAYVSQAKIRSDLAISIAATLSRVDSPTGMEFLVRCYDAHSDPDNVPFAAMHLSMDWDEEHGLMRGRHLSHETISRLKTLWQDKTLGSAGRRIAFSLWATNHTEAPTSVLAEATSSEPFYQSAIQKRVQRGDKSVVPALLELARKSKHLLQNADRVWCPEMFQFVRDLAISIKDRDPKTERTGAVELQQILARVPIQDAETIVLEAWDSLRDDEHFLLIALWIGTPRCIELVANCIRLLPQKRDVFKHASFVLPLWPREGEEVRSRSQILRFLTNVLPYLEHFETSQIHDPVRQRPKEGVPTPNPSLEEIVAAIDIMPLRDMVEACLRVGASDWGRLHLDPYLTEGMRHEFFPTDTQMLADLDDLLESYRPILDKDYYAATVVWLDRAQRRGDAHEHAVDIMLRWLEAKTLAERFYFVGTAIHIAGSRSAQLRLERCFLQAKFSKEERESISPIVSAARFAVQRRSLK